MIIIHYPEPDFQIKNNNQQQQIFDKIRKKWVVLTPEEWVRQNFIAYLIQVKKYPATLFSVEKEIKQTDFQNRYDLVVYKQEKPWLLVECKEPGTLLSAATVQQIVGYNQQVNANYLVLVNGNDCFAWDIKKEEAINDLPDW